MKKLQLSTIPYEIELADFKDEYMRCSHIYMDVNSFKNDLNFKRYVENEYKRLVKQYKKLISESGITNIVPGDVLTIYLVGKTHIEFLQVFTKEDLEPHILFNILE